MQTAPCVARPYERALLARVSRASRLSLPRLSHRAQFHVRYDDGDVETSVVPKNIRREMPKGATAAKAASQRAAPGEPAASDGRGGDEPPAKRRALDGGCGGAGVVSWLPPEEGDFVSVLVDDASREWAPFQISGIAAE